MSANEFFKNAELTRAIEAQTQAVKADPGDQGKRLFLFELLAFSGDLDRAQRQIDAVQYDDPLIEAAVQEYRRLLDAERARRQTFGLGTAPEFFQEPPLHVKIRLEAIQQLVSVKPAEARAELERADKQSPAVSGTCNGTAFDGLRDGDDRMASVLEVMAHGHYYWVPFEQIQILTSQAPRTPRDLLWLPAQLELRDGTTGNVFLPCLYPGSQDAEDPLVKLGRQTDWVEDGPGPVIGLGRKTCQVGEEWMSVLEWRQLELT
jgi:type VI secretion system protein ImpE